MVLNHANVRNARTTNNAVTDEFLLPAAYDVAIEGISDSGRGQRELYYLGIIDFLQEWTAGKKVAAVIKKAVAPQPASTIPPHRYSVQFHHYFVDKFTPRGEHIPELDEKEDGAEEGGEALEEKEAEEAADDSNGEALAAAQVDKADDVSDTKDVEIVVGEEK